MTAKIFSFILWSICGIFFICLSIYALFAKKAVGFWANAEVFEVTNIKQYNTAMAKLFFVFGIIFILLGLPLLLQNMAWILLSVIGVMFETITTMSIYTIIIEKKYKKSNRYS